jgi:hypothetical protein
MDIVFVDDSESAAPSRPGTRHMVAAGRVSSIGSTPPRRLSSSREGLVQSPGHVGTMHSHDKAEEEYILLKGKGWYV